MLAVLETNPRACRQAYDEAKINFGQFSSVLPQRDEFPWFYRRLMTGSQRATLRNIIESYDADIRSNSKHLISRYFAASRIQWHLRLRPQGRQSSEILNWLFLLLSSASPYEQVAWAMSSAVWMTWSQKAINITGLWENIFVLFTMLQRQTLDVLLPTRNWLYVTL